MSKEVLIKIKTVITYDDLQQERIYEEHQGKYYVKADYNYLNYQEQAPDTEQRVITTIRWQEMTPLQVVVIRQGSANAKNVFQEGLVDCCSYQTAEGEIMIETATDRVELTSDKTGGKLLAAYHLKMNDCSIGEYELTISYSFVDL